MRFVIPRRSHRRTSARGPRLDPSQGSVSKTLRILAVTIAALLPLVAAPGVDAQIVASELSTLTQTIAGTELELVYSRPSLRGRDQIFGGIHPYGEQWTGGANSATELRLSKDVVISGVTVPAGAYSVWFEVQEGNAWRMMLHEDTAMFHAPHPPIDEEQILVDVSREHGDDLIETLTWAFEDLQWNGATLAMAWGHERLRVDVQVDPGFQIALTEEEAEPYVGEWRIDDSRDRPSAETIEQALGTEDLDPIARSYYEAMRDVPHERVIRIFRDPETGWLFRTDPDFAPLWASFMGQDESDPRFEILIPRGDGFFRVAMGVGGQLMGFDPQFAYVMEFRFDDDGRAVSFESRNPDEELAVTGERAGG